MKAQHGIKPQDVVLLLKLASTKDGSNLNQLQLSRELCISQSEISAGIRRSIETGLLIPNEYRVMKQSFLEFLLYGLPFIFPAKLGPVDRGMPTSHSAPPLNKIIQSNTNDQYVWPDATGKVRGQTIVPIYPSAPNAAKNNPKLYELLCLVDALRVGRTREKNYARSELKKRLCA